MRRLCHGRNRGGSTTLPHLTELTWREARTAGADAIALMPIGSQEQHGAHLPMGTDTLLVTAVVDRAAELLAGDGPPVVRLPALPYGHSPHHLFAAAVSLSASTLAAVLADVLRSLTESGFRRIMIVNGHGGNDEIMRLAVKEHALRAEGAFAACSYWSLGEAPENPGHAGRYETSLMLAAHPDLVRTPIEPHTPAGAPPLFAAPPHPGLTAERHGEWARVGGMTDDPSAARPDPGGLTIRATELARAIRAFAEATAPGAI
ncbi:creatininase family protein [Streptomyces malaysiensis subsp. malaysiensis]|uniref:Creatininase family protein n=1 Tax=Streptomyces malaysiensis TaxID=92644 RepID=A0ABX6WGW9_STRMQ|nr:MULTISPECIES: creatininase family protein [Streptomyces]MCC4316819.1 creatininase family protein [Streptomyces malaysiensis]MCM3812200.1 creatininase family protein [Streptomyces sp. DR7-3]MCQ6249996.1 creatininase family protein [Streptomyces malaysiensis]QPI60688.1 creatininase family protein [Streptomyces solisilvae]UHH22417.1 creatininase family protein [Streptomyces sp. HNM0561]